MQKSSKGFTLLELLIVIAILAILSAVTVIVLNPAELLKKARDSQRLSDISTIKTALGFYIINTSSADLDWGGSRCVDVDATDEIFTHRSAPGTAPLGWVFVPVTTQVTDGTGWIPVNLSQLTGGSPLAKFPIDPSNTGPVAGSAHDDLYYTYACDQGAQSFEINANMESAFYRNLGPGDVEGKDGGQIATIFEDGTALNILPSSLSNDFYAGE